MAISATGTPSDGLVYITMSGKDAAGHAIVEQGSGILLSDDEVLTAAHLVYNPDGTLRTSGTAAVGYHAGSSIASSKIDGVQADAFQDYTSIGGMGQDFAVVHLSTKVTNGTVFSLGSGPTSGEFQVSGYPIGTAGGLDTKTEALSIVSGTQVYAGETLHDGAGDPRGSSGGSVYQVVNGSPVAYGVISAMSTSDTTQGVFKALSAADVAQIQAWISGADAAGSRATALGATTTASLPPSAAASTAATVAHSAPGFHTDMADVLSADAGSASGGKQAAMADVAAAITKACRDGGSFDAMAQDASSYLHSTSSNAGRDVAYLAGLLSATTGSWVSNITKTANALIGGSVFSKATRSYANAGRREGLGMGIANTSAVIDQGSAMLANVLSATGHPSDTATSISTHDPRQSAVVMGPSCHDHGGSLFG